MDMSTFLKVLPGALGLAGFLTLATGKTQAGGELAKAIVAKLRAAPNVRIQDLNAMSPAKLLEVLESDSRARAAVDEKQLRLLRLVVVMQQGRRSFALFICVALIGLSAWLVLRPQPPDHDPPQPGEQPYIAK
jgi:hypothetical protein